MKEVTVTMFEAFDGEQFKSARACRAHESKGLHVRLSGLTPEQVQAALDRTDPALADAFEEAGLKIRDARRKAGLLRRTPAAEKPAPAEPAGAVN